MNVEWCRNMLLCITMQDGPHFCSKLNKCLLGSYRYVLQYSNQTCPRPKGFVISYLLFWPAFIWRIFFWKRKIQLVAFYKQSGWWKFEFSETHKFSVLELWNSFFSSATLFLEDSQLIFLLQKNCQIKKGQNNKYDITKTSGLVQRGLVSMGA